MKSWLTNDKKRWKILFMLELIIVEYVGGNIYSVLNGIKTFFLKGDEN